MKLLHIIGRKNSGKTTLVVELVRHLTSRGIRVGTVKHTHHHHELDTPGKDSHRHRQSGAPVVGILSPAMWGVFRAAESSGATVDPYAQMAPMFADCDLVLVEGHSQAKGPRIEVWRDVVSEQPLARDDTSIVAIVTDDPIGIPIPVWSRTDVMEIANRILELVGVDRESR